MARATPGRSPTRGLRFFQDEAGSGAGGGDGGSGSGDGGGGDAVYSAGMTLFPAVYNNGGVVADVSYIMTAGQFAALFTAAGFASESGFIANVAGVATPGITFLTSTSVLGALPFGTAEFFTTLTMDGVTNLSRWLVRLGP